MSDLIEMLRMAIESTAGTRVTLHLTRARQILDALEAARADAGRYRWAKENRWPRACPTGYYLSDGAIYPSEDAAIDAAIAAQQAEGGGA